MYIAEYFSFDLTTWKSLTKQSKSASVCRKLVAKGGWSTTLRLPWIFFSIEKTKGNGEKIKFQDVYWKTRPKQLNKGTCKP